jgi:hypothetical protein
MERGGPSLLQRRVHEATDRAADAAGAGGATGRSELTLAGSYAPSPDPSVVCLRWTCRACHRRIPEHIRKTHSATRSPPAVGACELSTIEIDYLVDPVPRWGHGRPPHPQLHHILDSGRSVYAAHPEAFVAVRDRLARIPIEESAGEPDEPAWLNPWFSGLDAVALYGFPGKERPRFYLEVGSGISTRFAPRGVRDLALPTRIVSIDPSPRAEIDRLCDTVVREPVQTVGHAVFDQLNASDVLFIDGSHRVFTNSDCVVLLLEILPALPSGVWVHVQDIFLPYDYPPEWNGRFYSEQYLLAALLLGGSRGLSVELPAYFVSEDPSLRTLTCALWTDELASVRRHGGSFWMRISTP